MQEVNIVEVKIEMRLSDRDGFKIWNGGGGPFSEYIYIICFLFLQMNCIFILDKWYEFFFKPALMGCLEE